MLADSELLFLPAAALYELLDHDRAFARALLAGLSQRIHSLIADIGAYSLSSGRQREIVLRDPAGAWPSSPAAARNAEISRAWSGRRKRLASGR